MHLLGRHLPDHKPLRIALTSFYGLSHSLTPRLLARLQIPTDIAVADLTENQITALSAYLSSPSTTPRPSATPLYSPSTSEGEASSARETAVAAQNSASGMDPLDDLKIETDLRRSMQADIAHQRQVGSYRGRRHALGLPVRGQKTRNNAQIAKKQNRVDRRAFSTSAIRPPSTTSPILSAATAFRR